jgi:hypothetical protein
MAALLEPGTSPTQLVSLSALGDEKIFLHHYAAIVL